MIESSSSRGVFFLFFIFPPSWTHTFSFFFCSFLHFLSACLADDCNCAEAGWCRGCDGGNGWFGFSNDSVAGGEVKVYTLVGRWGGGERSMGYAYSYTTRGLCRWKLVIRIELEDLGKLIVDASLEMLHHGMIYSYINSNRRSPFPLLVWLYPACFLYCMRSILHSLWPRNHFPFIFVALYTPIHRQKLQFDCRLVCYVLQSWLQ